MERLERKFGKYAIKNLMLHITILNAIMYVVAYVFRQNEILSYLVLNPDLVVKGQIWRIFTFVMVPPATSIFWIVFVLYFYYFIGTGLQSAWGDFKFNVYYFLGVLLTAAVSMVSGVTVDGTFLNLSLFFGFATLYPNMQVLLFFILPIKIKYLAYVYALSNLYFFITGSNAVRVVIIGSLLNFFIFFGKSLYRTLRYKIRTYRKRNRF